MNNPNNMLKILVRNDIGDVNETYRHCLGKSCNITVGKDTFENKIPVFVGTNGIGQLVISTEDRAMLYPTTWDEVAIEIA